MNIERGNRGRRVVTPRGHRARAIDRLLNRFGALFHSFLDRMDAAIVAAMRSAPSMSVESGTATGGAIADTYRLRGAATAIDAAALGCAKLR